MSDPTPPEPTRDVTTPHCQLTLLTKVSGAITTKTFLTKKEVLEILSDWYKKPLISIPATPGGGNVSETLYIIGTELVGYVIVELADSDGKSRILRPQLVVPQDVAKKI